ncbi:MAG: DUF58 domain-containing protein, partial [Glaciihabitans sp.]
MAITGWFVALLAAGAVPLVLTGQGFVLVLWIVVVLLLGAGDLALAGSPRAVALRRIVPARVRLGETVTADLVLSNTGRRRLRAVVR